MFIEDGAYTSLAAAVSILLVLTLVFSSASALWTLSRSGDVQVAADATALAGANVVASYRTAATVVDASALSLGLAGYALCGAGMVGMLVPGAHAAGAEMVEAGLRALRARREFCVSASHGLRTLEGALPYLVATRGSTVCGAQGSDALVCTGVALAVPRDSDSRFPALEGEGPSLEGLESAASSLEVVSRELEDARMRSAREKEAAWRADCGPSGPCMRERVSRLSGVPASQNPHHASSLTWDPQVALERTRVYYRWRRDHEAPQGGDVESRVDAAARLAFYTYACEEFERALYREVDGEVVCDVPLLPRNKAEVMETRLFTDAVWPTSVEADGPTLHFDPSCPGAQGSQGAMASLSSIEEGAVRECRVCHMSVGDMGKVPAASTSIDNGFEYHLRAFTLALGEYARTRSEELELERAARGPVDRAGDAFEDALSQLSCARPRIAPPGRFGCVALVASGSLEGVQMSRFAPTPEVVERGAVSAAVLARDGATRENNVLSGFLSSLRERSGGGAVGLMDDVMGLWGKLLMAYGDVSDGLDELLDDLVGGLGALGATPLGAWLDERVDGAVRGLGIEPVDLSLHKPVLADSAQVIARSDLPGLADVQARIRSLEIGTTDPGALLEAVGYEVEEAIASMEFTIVEIPLGPGRSIPLTIRLRDVTRAWEGGP
ncbi:MAG: hypothetical protein SOU51_03600 [Collinsella sp.]|nr:hypothetical protein [Collinsella sp.]